MNVIAVTGSVFIFSRIVIALGIVFSIAACAERDTPIVLGDYRYPQTYSAQCSADTRSGSAGRSDGLELVPGVAVNVRTPANYRADFAHPLLMVYAPAGQDAAASETLAALTTAATARGYVVAYAASRPLTMRSITRLTELPDKLAERWCIDRLRVAVAGHSDGATVGVASALLRDSKFHPRAVAVSAAGFRGEDLARMSCPDATPAILIQMREDRLFPGYVRELADWWAACNGCETGSVAVVDGCRAYHGCRADGQTSFCEIAGPHAHWPGINDEMLEFLGSAIGVDSD